MECWLCMLLVLHCTTVIVSQTCNEGDVEIIGTVTDNLIAGRLEICVGGRWHAMYADLTWDMYDVWLICEERGFPREGASFCRSSCFGASDLPTGYNGFSCSEATQFRDCRKNYVNQRLSENNAGVICIKENMLDFTLHPNFTPCPDSTPCPDCISHPTPPPCDYSTATPKSRVNSNSDNSNRSMVPPQDPPATISAGGHGTNISIAGNDYPNTIKEDTIAIKAALGVVSTLLLLSLVGIAIGWVWSWYKRKKTRVPDNLQPNPSYGQTTPTTKWEGEDGYYEEISGQKDDVKVPDVIQPNLCYAHSTPKRERE